MNWNLLAVQDQERFARIEKELAEEIDTIYEELDIQFYPPYRLPKNREYYLTLLEWSRRYCLPFRLVLRTLALEYRRFRKETNNPKLAIPLSVIASPKSEALLRSLIPRAYILQQPIFPKRYNSIDERVELMKRMRKKANRAPELIFRGAKGWSKPAMDRIRKGWTE